MCLPSYHGRRPSESEGTWRALGIPMRVLPGSSFPLGAQLVEGAGVNFALYSENATGVELCLIDKSGEETRAPLRERTGFTWHGFVPGCQAGQRYGFRVSGPWEPERGLR